MIRIFTDEKTVKIQAIRVICVPRKIQTGNPMTTKAVRALFWKEYRQQITLLIALFVICILVQMVCFSLSLFSNEYQWWRDFVPPYTTIAMLFTALYAAGAAAILFTIEHEDRTFQFLRALPIDGKTVLVGKVSWLFVSTCALGIVLLLESAIWCYVTESSDSAASVFGMMGVAVVEALCWGLFWTTRCRSQLYSVLLTFVSVSVACHAMTSFINSSELQNDFIMIYASASSYRLLLAGVVGAVALWDAKKWLQKRIREPGNAKINIFESYYNDYYQLATPPMRSEFLALVWQAFRQSRKLILAMPVFCLVVLCFLMVKEVSNVQLERDFFEFYTVGIVLAVFFPLIFCASVFFRDQQSNRAAMLTNMGISPGQFWASRILLFGGVYLLLPIAFTVYRLWWVFHFTAPGSTMSELIFSAISTKELAFVWLDTLAIFCVGQMCSLLTRSIPIAFVLTVGGSFLALGGIFLMDIFCVSWWLMLLPFLGMLVATRLRTADWMRGRDRWRSFIRPMAAIVVPCVLVYLLIPVIRIYSVPDISLGYKMTTDTHGMVSPDKSAKRYHQLVGKMDAYLDDIPTAKAAWLEIQAMSVDAKYPHYEAQNPYLIFNVSRNIKLKADDPQCTQEYLRDAIAFLGQMPETMTPASECVKRFFDARLYDLEHNIIRNRKVNVLYPYRSPVVSEVYFHETSAIPLRDRLLAPWEYARARRIWNCYFQIQTHFADSNENYFYQKDNPLKDWTEYEIDFLSDSYNKPLKAPGTFFFAAMGNENLPASPYWDQLHAVELERLSCIAKCALKLWWLETGELPEIIEQLKNEYLDSSPHYETILCRTQDELELASFGEFTDGTFPLVVVRLCERERFKIKHIDPGWFMQCTELGFCNDNEQ